MFLFFGFFLVFFSIYLFWSPENENLKKRHVVMFTFLVLSKYASVDLLIAFINVILVFIAAIKFGSDRLMVSSRNL